MERYKRKFSVKKPISAGTNFLTSSLALMGGRNLGNILNTELQECAYFCHASREPTCTARACNLPAAANQIRGAKQRAGAGKSWLGVQKKQMKGAEVSQWHIQHHEVSKPFGWSISSPCPQAQPHVLSARAQVWQRCRGSGLLGSLLSAISRGNAIHPC